MSQQNLLELAKQGNPDAIATLINRSLKSKGITAKVIRKEDCLRVSVEGVQACHKDSLISFICNGVKKLEIPDISTLQVFEHQTSNETSNWHRTITLDSNHTLQAQKQQPNPSSHIDGERLKPKRKSRPGQMSFDTLIVCIICCFMGLRLGIFLNTIFEAGDSPFLPMVFGLIGLSTSLISVLVLRYHRSWNIIRFAITFVSIIGLVGYCALPKQHETVPQAAISTPPISTPTTPTTPTPTLPTTSTSPVTAQTKSQSKQGEWYEGGTLHHASALEWQQASYENKLATCADFVSGLWQEKSLTPLIQNQINSMDDIDTLSRELLTSMDIAMKEIENPEENRRVYTNQKVSEIATALMILMGWVK